MSAIDDFLDDATTTRAVQHRNGKTITWHCRVLDARDALEVPEILDRIQTAAAALLQRPAASSNPMLDEALRQVRARGEECPDPAVVDLAAARDILERLQRIAMRAVVAIEVDGARSPCRLVSTLEEQQQARAALSEEEPGAERLIWVGVMGNDTLQAVYLAAALRIEEAVERLARFRLAARPAGDPGPGGEGLRSEAEPAPRAVG